VPLHVGRRVFPYEDIIVEFCSQAIHRSAWKGNSANFAFWGFSGPRFLECFFFY
jgi:hypothetical protein